MKLTKIILSESVKAKLSSLNYNEVHKHLGDGFSAPNPDDSLRRINGENDWESWKQRTIEQFGDVDIEIDDTAVWYDKIKIIDPKFTKQKDDYVAAKAAWLDRERAAGRSSGLD